MDKIKDYAEFVGWFAGLGYIVLWPVTNSAYPLTLPPGLHVIGILSAIFVTLKLMVHAIRRTRSPNDAAAPAPFARITAASRKPLPPRRAVKPRDHFGLRGIKQRAPVMEKDDA